MRTLRNVLRIASWTLATVISLIVTVYVTALVINREDRPPSREARQMAALLDTLPAVPDEDNAYVYLLGFAAPRGADPWQIGLERADWIRRLRSNSQLGSDSDPYPTFMHDVWNPEEATIFRRCAGATQQGECFAMLSGAGAELEEWLAGQAWVLARYETLLSYPSWRAIQTYDHRAPFPVSNIVEPRNAWFLEVWSRANRGDAAGVREALRKDLGFWRLVLAESQSLLMKVVAAGFVKDHFEQSNLILKRLPADRIAQAVPSSWREPISADERSMHRVFAFELRYVRRGLERTWSETGIHPAWSSEHELSDFLQSLSRGAAGALFQTQDFLNKRAHAFSLVASALDEPYERIPEALARAQAANAEEAGAGAWSEVLYNFVGDALREAGAGAYDDYGLRVSDIEGVRRAALLAADLRSRGIAPGEVAAALANAELSNPYTGEPFGWDAESGEIVFDGLARPRAGLHALWY